MKPFDYKEYMKNNPLLRESEESNMKQSHSSAKLGDIFMYKDPRGGVDVYILAKSINPRKPDVVGLWRINPKTMKDSPTWKYRKMWHQIKVADPENITDQELETIMYPEYKNRFTKLDSASQMKIMQKIGKKAIKRNYFGDPEEDFTA